MIPPGRWDGVGRGMGIQSSAGSRDELERELLRHRVSNGLAVGDPAADIAKYVIEHFPDYAGAVSMSRPPIDEDTLAGNLRERVTNFASNKYSLRRDGNDKLVDQETANARAEVCAGCAYNVDYPHDCASCVTALEPKLFILRQGQQTVPQVKSCAIVGQSNAVACWLPEGKMLAHAKKFEGELREKMPNCWLLNNHATPAEISPPYEKII